MSPQYGTISRGDQPATWWQVCYLGPLLSFKQKCFVLTEIDIYYRYIFAFPACNVSAQIAIHRLTEYLIHYHGIPHSIASDYATNFIANEA